MHDIYFVYCVLNGNFLRHIFASIDDVYIYLSKHCYRQGDFIIVKLPLKYNKKTD